MTFYRGINILRLRNLVGDRLEAACVDLRFGDVPKIPQQGHIGKRVLVQEPLPQAFLVHVSEPHQHAVPSHGTLFRPGQSLVEGIRSIEPHSCGDPWVTLRFSPVDDVFEKRFRHK